MDTDAGGVVVGALLGLAGPGPDGTISLAEAVSAIDNSVAYPNYACDAYAIRFDVPFGSVISFPSTLYLHGANTTIDGDVNGSGKPGVVLAPPPARPSPP